MLKKIAVIALASLALGGCSLQDMLKTDSAVTDEKAAVVATSTPAPTSASDQELESMPSTSNSSDVTSLEADINSTVILDEDFSDLN